MTSLTYTGSTVLKDLAVHTFLSIFSFTINDQAHSFLKMM
jgi:hypothetical protein